MKSNLELKIKITDTKEYHKIISKIKYEMNELEKENNVLRKALELACLEHKKFGYCCYADPECDKTVLTCEECCIEYFKHKAKEMLNDKSDR